jgi:hypothetical protein
MTSHYDINQSIIALLSEGARGGTHEVAYHKNRKSFTVQW